MKKYFNFMFYFVYKFNYRSHLFFKKINPVIFLHRLTHNKEEHQKYNNTLDKVWNEKEHGLSSYFAGGLIMGLYAIFFFSIIIYLTSSLNADYSLNKYESLISLVPSFILTHFLVFKDDKYLEYFNEFDQIPKKKKRKLYILYFINIILIILFFISSLMFMSYRKF